MVHHTEHRCHVAVTCASDTALEVTIAAFESLADLCREGASLCDGVMVFVVLVENTEQSLSVNEIIVCGYQQLPCKVELL